MPLRLDGAGMDAIRVDDLAQTFLGRGNSALGEHLNGHCIAVFSPMTFGLDAAIKNEIENLNEPDEDGRKPKRTDKLVVVLETTGGFIEVVERIVSVFRRHYKRVVFIIPNYAYSAGTVLALSGDEIYMNYYSILGPIDPQFPTEGGRSVPGMGYIAKYNELRQIINSVPDDQVGSVRAEMSVLLRNFDQAKLFQIQQAINHSKELVEEWLPKYKFRTWRTTESGKKVTPQMRKDCARRIAAVLGDAEHWHSHGRGISMAELSKPKIGLKVNDFGTDAMLNMHVTHYHGLFSDFMQSAHMKAAIHTRKRIRRLA